MTKQQKTKVCTGPECDRDAVSKGLCGSHYAQSRAGKELTVLKPRKRGTPKKLIELEGEIKAAVEKKVVPPTPPVKKKREPLHGMREWICPKCLKGGKFLGSQASHRCTMNKNLITDWVLRENYKPPVPVED